NLNKKQAHHIIPVELAEKNSIVKEAINQGFDFNGIINGVALSKARHSGRHPNYTNLVKNILDNVKDLNPNASSKEIVEKVADQLRDLINNTSGKIDDIVR
ncbi:MAG: AHH domain-containing protein, partial [Candidatus Kapaibacterium sp.]